MRKKVLLLVVLGAFLTAVYTASAATRYSQVGELALGQMSVGVTGIGYNGYCTFINESNLSNGTVRGVFSVYENGQWSTVQSATVSEGQSVDTNVHGSVSAGIVYNYKCEMSPVWNIIHGFDGREGWCVLVTQRP